MESLDPECTPLKHKYERCFYSWYSDRFLKGTAVEDDCKELFDQYQQCLQRALKQRNVDRLLKDL